MGVFIKIFYKLQAACVPLVINIIIHQNMRGLNICTKIYLSHFFSDNDLRFTKQRQLNQNIHFIYTCVCCARQFHYLSVCMQATFAKDASRPRVNVPPVFLRERGWKHPQHIAISFANVLSEMTTTTCRTSSSYSFDICCSRGISVAPLTSVSSMPQVYVTLRNFRQGERES